MSNKTDTSQTDSAQTSSAQTGPPQTGSAVMSFDPTTDPTAVSLTPAAAVHLGASMSKNAAQAVRLGVTESGCNGYMYDLSFAATPNPDDHRYEFPGAQNEQENGQEKDNSSVTVVVSPQDLPLVQGTEIDYVTEGLNSSLKFSNPNADTHCGCGESFSVSAPESS